MTKFCTKCGRPLKKGESCSCSRQQENTGKFAPETPIAQNIQGSAQNVLQAQNLNKIKDTGKNVWEKFCRLLKNPLEETIGIAGENGTSTALAFIAVQAAVVFLVMLFTVSRFKSTMGIFGNGVSAVLSAIRMALFLAASDFGVAGALYIGEKMVFRENTTYQRMLAIVGCKSVIDAVAYLAGGLVGILGTLPGMAVFCVGSAFSFSLLTLSYAEVSALPKGKKYVTVAAAQAVYLVVLLAGLHTSSYSMAATMYDMGSMLGAFW